MRIEAFYTGGGITLVEASLDGGRYAVVSSDAPDYLAVYRRVEDAEPYMPEDMLLSAKRDDLPLDLQELHGEMLEKLNA